MANKAIYWNEGLFLRPHHFQANDRYQAIQQYYPVQLLSGQTAGIGLLEIDLDALANHIFRIKTLKAMLPDRTIADIPGESATVTNNFKALLDRDSSVTFLLGIPMLSLGRANSKVAEESTLTRNQIEAVTVEDENDGQRPEEILVKRLNFRLLTQSDKTDGLAVLTLARVIRSNRPDGAPQLDPDFYPPLFLANGYAPMADNIIQYLLNRVGRKATGVATQLRAGGLGMGAREPLLLSQLNCLNAAHGALQAMANNVSTTVGELYLELCRLAGALAVYGQSRLLPPLPTLDSWEPHKTFVPLRRLIEEYLDMIVEPEFKDRPFIGAGLRMQVTLEPAWLQPDWGMFIGVQSDQPTEEVVRILTQPGVLDMKVGSADQADAFYRAGKAGLSFTPIKTPPRVLPPGVTYFQLSRDQTGSEWGDVKRTLSLAIRFNENRVQGNIQDQQVLTLSLGGKTSRIQFTLFVVAPKSMV